MPDISIIILDNIFMKATESKEHERNFRDSDYQTKEEANPDHKTETKLAIVNGKKANSRVG